MSGRASTSSWTSTPPSAEEARQLAREVADRLLANPVIESYRLEVEPEEPPMKFAIVVFPGSNCDHDAYHAAKHVLGQEAAFVWHKDTDPGGADVVILPGGFAHGDYLRTGAIARFSPVMAAVQRVRRQRRTGARHLQRLPGPARSGPAAGRDAAQRRPASSAASTSTCGSSRPTRRSRATAAPARCCGCRSRTAKATTTPTPTTLARLEANRQVVFRYVDAAGDVTPEANPNGSVRNIAGLCNERATSSA